MTRIMFQGVLTSIVERKYKYTNWREGATHGQIDWAY